VKNNTKILFHAFKLFFYFVNRTMASNKTNAKLKDRLIVQLKPDNPVMVRKRLTQKSYVARVHKSYEDITVTVPALQQMEAATARKMGYDISPGIHDQQLVEITVMETHQTQEKRFELNLVYRGRYNKITKTTHLPRYSKHRSERIEFANGARERPMSFVQSDKLRELISDEISHWTTNDINGHELEPILICPLDVQELDDGEYNITQRGLFYIHKYSIDKFVVSDQHDNYYEVYIPEEVMNKCRLINFILFLPSNAVFISKLTHKRFL